MRSVSKKTWIQEPRTDSREVDGSEAALMVGTAELLESGMESEL